MINPPTGSPPAVPRLNALVLALPEDERVDIEERAAIKEYCGNIQQGEAEQQAYDEHISAKAMGSV